MAQENVGVDLAGVDLNTIATDVDQAVELVQGLIEFADKYGAQFIPPSYLDTLNELHTFLSAVDTVLKKV